MGTPCTFREWRKNLALAGALLVSSVINRLNSLQLALSYHSSVSTAVQRTKGVMAQAKPLDSGPI